jgi:[ribosomal protein S18]-alanine N-acetyltransferase
MTTIAPMTRAHIAELMPYELELFGPEAWSADGYRDELADTRYRRYVVALGPDGELLGWAGVRVLDALAEILTVGVIPAVRRQGIGRQLLQVLLDEARSRGATEVFLEVRADNSAAQTLYETEGFLVLGRRRGYYDHGRMDAVTMRLAL